MATVIIELEIDGDPSDALAAVDNALDAGVLQDALEDDDDYDVAVTSAICHLVEQAPSVAVPPAPTPMTCDDCGGDGTCVCRCPAGPTAPEWLTCDTCSQAHLVCRKCGGDTTDVNAEAP